MSHFFRLVGHYVVACDDVQTWAKWYEQADRQVAFDVCGEGRVSTVFLGIDHRFVGQGPPVLYETLVFGGPLNGEQSRSATWPDAERDHASMVARVLAAERPPL